MKKTILTLAIQAAVMGAVPMMAMAADEVEVTKVASSAEQEITEKESIEKESTEKETSEQATKADGAAIEKIAITGSRIKRDSFSLATPMMGLSAEEIADSGLGSLSEILVDQIPSIAEGVSNTTSQSSVQNSGLSTVDLRNLGTDRTLTLIDGRRAVSNSYSGNYVSLSTIPTAMVDKVEVITGGASAVYGSDAIAGVVNIITKQKGTGFEVNAKGGETFEGGGREFTLDLGYGADFANDRGYLYASATYDKQYGLFATERERGLYESTYKYDAAQMCNAMKVSDPSVSGGFRYQCMREIGPEAWRERSNDISGGLFSYTDSKKNKYASWYNDTNQFSTSFSEERDGFNSAPTTILKVPEDSLNAAFKVDYDFTDELQGYAQVQFSKNNSFRLSDPEGQDYNDDEPYIDAVTGKPGTLMPGAIKKGNPFIPKEIASVAAGSINWDRRFDEVGPVNTDNERTTYRSWAGLKGYVFGDWNWDASVGYGKFEQVQQRYNEISVSKLRDSLDAVYGTDGKTIQCASATARADGCVPINIFGTGSISAEAADYIRANPYINTDISQLNMMAYMNGELFEMPAGGAQAAFGVEYRRDTQSVQTDEAMRSLAVTFNDVPPFSGEVNVYEAFGEVSLPLVRDVVAVKKLDLDLSLRLADYSQKNIDLMSSYRAGIFWEPLSNYAVRANYSRSQRAPNITELVSPPRGDYDSVIDICSGVTATTTGQVAENCRKDPGVAAAIAATGTYKDAGGSKYSPNAGNENLFEETADTYTLGFTIAPEFVPNLKLAADYYDITVFDAISQFSNEDILSLCYDSDTYGSGNSYCSDITRDSEGQLTEIIQREQNLDEVATSGYDFSFSYDLELDAFGEFKLAGNWTHVLDYKISYTSVTGRYFEDDYVGQLSSGIFEDKAGLSLTWKYDDLRIRWSAKYKGEMVDDFDRLTQYQKDIAANQAKLDAGTGGIANPEAMAFYDYGSHVTHDMTVSYTLDVARETELRLYAGVRNIFDNLGPWVPSSGVFATGRGNYHSEYGAGFGRYGYLGAELKF